MSESETACESQVAFVTRGLGEEALSSEHESLKNLAVNADLYIFNHEVSLSGREELHATSL